MRVDALGNLIAGVGDNPLTLWPIEDDAPFACAFNGGAMGWMAPTVGLAAGPDIFAVRSPEWEREAYNPYQPNDAYAGGGKWIASRATENTLQGTVPPGYEAWKAHDVGPDGTMILVLNGVYTVIWPTGDVDSISNVRDLRACAAGVLLTDMNGLLGIKRGPDSGVYIPQQLSVQKWWATSVGPSWLLYLADGYGLVLHHVQNDDDGYQWNVAPYSPCGVTLADGRTLIAWSNGAAEQAADLVRVFVTLGQDMQPLKPLAAGPDPGPEPPNPGPIDPPVPPIPVPPNPEPEPMPPTDPLKPGKTADAYWEALATTISTVPNNLMSFDDAKQGIRQTWDQLNAAQDWQHGNALVRGACSRSSSAAVVVPATTWDAVSPIVRAIDLEFLQRG